MKRLMASVAAALAVGFGAGRTTSGTSTPTPPHLTRPSGQWSLARVEARYETRADGGEEVRVYVCRRQEVDGSVTVGCASDPVMTLDPTDSRLGLASEAFFSTLEVP